MAPVPEQLTLSSLLNKLSSALIANQRPEDDDEAIYGTLAYLVCCKTNYHPALVAALQHRGEAFGKTFKTTRELKDYVVPIVERMSVANVNAMIQENIRTPTRNTLAP